MTDRVVLLGTKGGPALRPGGPWPTSSLVQMAGRTIVVDCGLGVTRALTDAGIDLKTLDLVVITHLHSDHVLELGPLLHTAWTAGLSRRVGILGPRGTARLIDHFLQSMQFDIAIRIEDEGRPDLREMVAVTEYEGGTILTEGGLSIRAMRVDHPPVTDTFALRFEASGRAIAFSADTAFHPPLADFARGADILVHEAMLPSGIGRLVARTGNGARLREHLLASHTMAADAGRIAAMAGVGHLVLHHLIPADDPLVTEADWRMELEGTWQGRLTIGRDGLVIELPDG